MTAKYPVETSDQEGIVDAVNYLLSGPSGLGQNFAGFSSFNPAWITGNFRSPYTSSSVAKLTVAPIALSTSESLSDRTFKYTFNVAQPSPPFANGNNVTIVGVLDPFYDGTYAVIGVVECTTTYCIVRTADSFSVEPPSTGGSISLNTGTGDLSTDANARVTVTGATDRIFVSGQLAQLIEYNVTTAGNLKVTVEINKYYGFQDPLPVNPDIKFDLRSTIARRVYNYPLTVGTGTLSLLETVFSSVVDQPDPSVPVSTDPEFSWTGFFWYILDVSFEFTTGAGSITTDELGFRSLSAQVVKQ
jgi:hypothetical protein